MSETISSKGSSGSPANPGSDPIPKPKPQPFSQSIPQPRQTGTAPRSASIFDESVPVVREDARQRSVPAVTGNAPERSPMIENPFAKAAIAPETSSPPRPAPPTGGQAHPAPAREPETNPRPSATIETPSHTLKAAEQLRAAAGEKTRQLREAAQAAQAAQAQAQAQAAQALASQAQAAQIRRETVAAAAPAPQPSSPLSPSALKVEEWREIAEATWADASVVLKDIQKESERYIRANPTRAALTALGVGFVLGVFLKR